MPKRQETFRLVPTTLVNNTTPRRPMTSKEAKKVYRAATKVPKLSRAEQRRLEAEEIARQKKEYEKERTAAKVKATKEKKQKKDAEEREKRKKMGLPEPSRYVRSSQPTIKTFVCTRAGAKRTWEEMDSILEEGSGTGDESSVRGNIDQTFEKGPQIVNALPEPDDNDEEFGDFPPLSQVDIPCFSEITNNGHYVATTTKTGPEISPTSTKLNPRLFFSTVSSPLCRMQGHKSGNKQGEALLHEDFSPKKELSISNFETSQQDEDDEFGEFPSLSQIDMAVHASSIHETEIALRISRLTKEANEEMAVVETVNEAGPDLKKLNEIGLQEKTSRARSALGQTPGTMKAEKIAEAKSTHRGRQRDFSDSLLKNSGATHKLSTPISIVKKGPEVSTTFSTNAQVSQVFKSVGSWTMKTPSPSALPSTINGSRKPLKELSGNMSPPKKPAISKAVQMLCNVHNEQKMTGSWNAERKKPSSSLVPSSTLAFLEAHFDDLFPSPSQQVRELVEEIDDIPSNTQVAKEIELDRSVRRSVSPASLPLPLARSFTFQDNDLHLLSSRDLAASPQDLTEIHGRNTVESLKRRRQTSTDRDLGLVGILDPPPSLEQPRKTIKPRFFEEKEEDLLIAALHESLRTYKQQACSSTPRRSQRVARNANDVKVGPSNDDYELDDFDVDSDLLAVLDEVESRALSSLRMKSCRK